MRTSFHHQPEAQHPNFQLSTSWQADYPIFGPLCGLKSDISRGPRSADMRRHTLQEGGSASPRGDTGCNAHRSFVVVTLLASAQLRE
jgi:hypothetical protein